MLREGGYIVMPDKHCGFMVVRPGSPPPDGLMAMVYHHKAGLWQVAQLQTNGTNTAHWIEHEDHGDGASECGKCKHPGYGVRDCRVCGVPFIVGIQPQMARWETCGRVKCGAEQ